MTDLPDGVSITSNHKKEEGADIREELVKAIQALSEDQATAVAEKLLGLFFILTSVLPEYGVMRVVWIFPKRLMLLIVCSIHAPAPLKSRMVVWWDTAV